VSGWLEVIRSQKKYKYEKVIIYHPSCIFGHRFCPNGHWHHYNGTAWTKGITGSGGQNYIPKWGADGTSLVNSKVYENGNAFYSLTDILPNPTHTYTVGSSTYRWKQMFSQYDLDYLSDERLKENIVTLDNKYVQFIRNINPVIFEWIKQKDGLNMGVTVQQIEQAMIDAGLYPSEFKFINKSNPDEYSMIGGQLISPLIKYAQNLEQELNTIKQENTKDSISSKRWNPFIFETMNSNLAAYSFKLTCSSNSQNGAHAISHECPSGAAK
jgi:hypothetical protein